MPEEHPLHTGMIEAELSETRSEKNAEEENTLTEMPLPSPDEGKAGGVPPEGEMRQLRSLLLQAEIDKISDLEHRLNDYATKTHEVSDVLAEAVVMRSGQDNMLNRAFEPIVESSLKASLKRNPAEFINVFFPLIGSTIRRSISESFNSMLGSFSKSLEQSLSLKGLQWRFEALRSGKPFSEIVMLHTMVYRVDQIFLIHSETGLVLAHMVNDGVTSKDADLVSGMLTAVQDFARDCFNNENDSSSLNSLKMDEYTIYIVRGPRAYIACMVRGTPPGEFLDRLNENLELILAECSNLFDDFKGDSSPFVIANKYLQDCLVQKFKDEDRSTPVWTKRLAIGVGVFIALLFIAQQYHSYKMDKGVDVLRNEPGLLVVDVKTSWGFRPWRVVCLHDELARPISQVLGENGYDLNDLNIHSIPFVSYEPEVTRLRVIKKILPPDGVEVSFKDGVLSLSGTADMNWILQARQTILATPGVLSMDTSGLHDPRVDELTELIQSVEAAVVRFPIGGDTPIPSDRPALDKVIDDLVSMERLANKMGLAVNLTIYGHADATGSEIRNYEISQSRARMIASKLFAQQANIPTVLYGIGADMTHGEEGEAYNQDRRKIDLRVRMVRLAETDQLPLLKKP
jgi:OOP family OmpA-OmpF porin